MSDNLDDFLNSLGIETTTEEQEALHQLENNMESALTDLIVAGEERIETPSTLEPNTQNLSDQDFADILEDFGFNGSQQAEAEEVQEEESEEEEEEGNTEEYNENGEETRDLDAEEDADWQEAIDSRIVVPVVGPNNQRVSITEEEASQINAQETIVEGNQVHFHMPDGEVIDVPILTEEEAARQAQELEATPHREPLLPLNSPTLLMDESTTRFSGAEWYNEIQKKSIIVAGQGGIGSNLSFQLARMHPAALFLYDDDMVETVNMAGQLYARNDVGKSKVAAISDMITAYTNMQNIYAIKDRFTSHTEAGDIMLCGFDNMEARRTFFGAWCSHLLTIPDERRKQCLFLDGRLSLDVLQVFCLTGDDDTNILRYQNEFLFSDAEAEHTVCSMKQTTYLACMIGSVMVNLFTNFCANLLEPIIPYDLPFFTEYDAQNMIFKTEK